MRAASAYQNEGKTFFQIASELRHAEREGADAIEVALLIDEVDTMLRYSASPMIRERCHALLRQHGVAKAGNTG
ncbi:hypothetical protein LB543_05205 [Mesorhizobium sp. ESP7-2]|uniref:hypothetical protein n=1 Tax=Mesorhizobium sp. ESP7-2 TaxID=2876622 RepID=UPI001CCF7225|nr:hypothetical protein [Mesorhizobium sp. ESP7-2]MBZ9706117.1 hypothetical protein [Mesorhizobium sp. ESP7-2]